MGNPLQCRATAPTEGPPYLCVLETPSPEASHCNHPHGGTTETPGPPRSLERSRKCPRARGGAPGVQAAAGSASAAAVERGRVGRGLERLRCGPAPPARGPAPAQVSGPAPAQVSGFESANVPTCPSIGRGCRRPPSVGSMLGHWRRRPGGMCGSAAARGPPGSKP